MECYIRTTSSVVTQKLRLETTATHKRLLTRASIRLRKKAIRNSILAVNLLVLFGVLAFVIHNSSSAQVSNQAVIVNGGSSSAPQANPLDQLSSAQIAVQVARMTGIYEQNSVTNLADSESADINVVPSDNQVISEPTVIATGTNAKSNQDIVKYTTVAGDSVSSLAIKFGVTSNSILWSNNLSSNTLTAGKVLYIPPVNGIVYTVKAGDTAQSLAQAYNANSADITSFNNAEISGLQAGEQIVIPNGSSTTVGQVAGNGSGSSLADANYTYGYTPTYGANGYDYGYCTWYVASQIAVPSNWGNASSWSTYAALSGWTVSPIPSVGSIAQTPFAAGGQGHVAIVTAVSPDGSSIYIKDMNNYGDGGGFGRVGGGWVPTSSFPNYITH